MDENTDKGIDRRSFKAGGKVTDERRDRVVAIVERLPEARAVATGNHLSLEVRRKRFGWYLDDHHGDGRRAPHCKAPRGVAQELARQVPGRFHIPKHVGHLGWIGFLVHMLYCFWTRL